VPTEKSDVITFRQESKDGAGTHSAEWVASRGHEKILRRQNFTRGRFLPGAHSSSFYPSKY
jgi:hypothetical protein